MPLPETIAIDGPAASGKTTLGKKLAQHLGYLLFDTGVMYRAVTWAALLKSTDMSDERAITELAKACEIDIRPATVEDGRDSDVLLDGADITWDIRRREVDANVSQVSAYRGVRQALTVQQQRIGKRGRVVMVGRDIGTVVMPNAPLKLYLEASAEERARRRHLERQARGQESDYDEILKAVKRRDEIDSSREVAPLCAAPDAIVLQSDNLNAEQVLEEVIALIEERA